MQKSNIAKTPEEATHIVALVRKLVLAINGNTNEEGIPNSQAKQVRLALKILSSRISSRKQSYADEQVTIERLKRSLAKANRVRDAVRLLELVNSLKQLCDSHQLKDILYFLEELSYHEQELSLSKQQMFANRLSEFSLDSNFSNSKNSSKTSIPLLDSGIGEYNQVEKLENGSNEDNSCEDSKSNNTVREDAFQEYIVKENEAYEISEAILVREAIYAVQGIEGKYVKYQEQNEEYAVAPHIGVPQPVRELVRRICKMGWLYKYLKQQLQQLQSNPSYGAVSRSFCGAVENELDEYYEMLAEIEAQAGMTNFENIENAGLLAAKGRNELTLRKLFVWCQQPLEKLKWLSVLTEAAYNKKGGELLSILHEFTLHGDKNTRSLVCSVLRKASVPLFDSIRKWVLDGELDDPYEEFFIASRQGITAEDIWEKKFYIRQSMVPSFLAIEPYLISSILSCGKTMVFLRKCCSDGSWLSDKFREPSFREKSLGYNQVDSLRAFVQTVCEASSNRLKFLLFEKFLLKGHCMALRNLILLGQGDFVQNLLDSLAADLNEPSSDLYRNNLLGTLDASLRSSSAAVTIANALNAEDSTIDNFTNEVLDRMDVRLLHPSSGAQGWDIFSLDYRFDVPLTSIFTKDVMEMYRKISRFLWYLKRSNYLLCTTWNMHFLSSSEERRNTKLQMKPNARTLYNKIHFVRMKMMHFVENFQYYVMFEVLEISWNELLNKLQKAQDMDELIQAQRLFISKILEKLMLKEKFRSQYERIRQLLDLTVRYHSFMVSI
ncbi:tubulin family protein [Galdieria sulphuraria]|uniref:Tubulin family protein n=1 Tax=Galdieria sulphuraria TaxID=130081 RepID=M2XJ75_GALSU|nr:tubulin family protein [Galdieria sulphuraria]EME30162.1 tubulin family protein [Galdieria sulphuraria]|eukprot:XP_005706682.1 tubulin family protein [Galdieria sulphuraria]